MLDTNIVVILILMGCVSGFMLISCVLILILERVKMIGQLKALGADNRQIRGIFIRLGARVTGIGLLVGNVLALALIAVQAHWHLLKLDPQSYYLSYVPIELTWQAWLLLNVGAAIFAFALMLLPTSLISRLSPVKVMRFE
jgi:lipoprotein-releasing system permease protein